MPTFNPNEILTQVQLGQINPNWRVIYPQRSNFIRAPITYIIIIFFSILALYIMHNDNSVFVPGYGHESLSHADFQLWQIIDYLLSAFFL